MYLFDEIITKDINPQVLFMSDLDFALMLMMDSKITWIIIFPRLDEMQGHETRVVN